MSIDWKTQERIDAAVRPYGKIDWPQAVIERATRQLEGKEDAVLLEAGCGSNCWITATLRKQGLRFHCIGVDIDESCFSNPDVDEARVASVSQLPLEDNSVDLIFSGYVLEHVEHPVEAFREAYRVLKPGGLFLAWTPNLYNPAMLLSAVTPHAFHVAARRLTWGEAGADNAPTFYRLNTIRSILGTAQQAGFHVECMERYSSMYSYFRINAAIYTAACVINKLALLWPLSMLRLTLLCALRKPA